MQAQRPVSVPASPPRAGYVRLPGHWPLVTRAAWVALAASIVYSAVITMPRVIAQMRTPCQPEACAWLQYTPPQIAAISSQLLPYESYMQATLALALVAMIGSWGISALIIWRRPDDWMAALVAYFLLLFGTTVTFAALQPSAQPWLDINSYLLLLLIGLQFAVFGLFPNGRFAPRWSAWLLMVAQIVLIPPQLFPNLLPISTTPLGPVGWVMEAGVLTVLATAQIYRYRAVSNPIERQQTKWAMLGLAVPGALAGALSLAVLLGLALGATNTPVALLYPLIGFILPIGASVGFGFAMLRSRLWEIDALINRALVYGALTLILTTAYAGLVIGLQTLARGLIGQNNSLVIVLSTLVIAALVLPLRRGLQAFIDRAFYRHKYDAAKTLQAFSATLLHEFQVEALREQLLRAVDETMRPAHVSLWLRPPSQGERFDGAGKPLHT